MESLFPPGASFSLPPLPPNWAIYLSIEIGSLFQRLKRHTGLDLETHEDRMGYSFFNSNKYCNPYDLIRNQNPPHTDSTDDDSGDDDSGDDDSGDDDSEDDDSAVDDSAVDGAVDHEQLPQGSKATSSESLRYRQDAEGPRIFDAADDNVREETSKINHSDVEQQSLHLNEDQEGSPTPQATQANHLAERLEMANLGFERASPHLKIGHQSEIQEVATFPDQVDLRRLRRSLKKRRKGLRNVGSGRVGKVQRLDASRIDFRSSTLKDAFARPGEPQVDIIHIEKETLETTTCRQERKPQDEDEASEILEASSLEQFFRMAVLLLAVFHIFSMGIGVLRSDASILESIRTQIDGGAPAMGVSTGPPEITTFAGLVHDGGDGEGKLGPVRDDVDNDELTFNGLRHSNQIPGNDKDDDEAKREKGADTSNKFRDTIDRFLGWRG